MFKDLKPPRKAKKKNGDAGDIFNEIEIIFKTIVDCKNIFKEKDFFYDFPNSEISNIYKMSVLNFVISEDLKNILESIINN